MKTTLFWPLLYLASASLVKSAEIPDIPFRHVIVDTNYPRRVQCRTVGDPNGSGYPDIVGANHGNHGVPTPVEAWLSQAGEKPAR